MNVKHRRCAEHGCNTRPAFNWKGEEKGAYCNKHKEKGMVNVDKKETRAGGPFSARLSPATLLRKCPHLPLALTGGVGCCTDDCHLMTRTPQVPCFTVFSALAARD